MSDPPPSPAATTASRPWKDHTSNRPRRPSLGSQMVRATCHGSRGNSPGANERPRSSTRTGRFASARRKAATAPPKPLPTTRFSTWSMPVSGRPGCWVMLRPLW